MCAPYGVNTVGVVCVWGGAGVAGGLVWLWVGVGLAKGGSQRQGCGDGGRAGGQQQSW